MTDQKRVADKRNDFFINVAQNLVERMRKSNRTINDYLLNLIKNTDLKLVSDLYSRFRIRICSFVFGKSNTKLENSKAILLCFKQN